MRHTIKVLLGKVWSEFSDLFGLGSWRSQLDAPVPDSKKKPTRVFRRIAFICLIFQIITGIFLAMHYIPSADYAYDSVAYIKNDVNFGWLIHNFHGFCSSLLIISMLLHFMEDYFVAGFKKPNRLQWYIGLILFCVFLAEGFTGYLLVWDQRAFWATTVGIEIIESFPVIGASLAGLLRGGAAVGQATLSRFYILHMIVIPGVIVLTLLIHLHRLKLGVSKTSSPSPPSSPSSISRSSQDLEEGSPIPSTMSDKKVDTTFTPAPSGSSLFPCRGCKVCRPSCPAHNQLKKASPFFPGEVLNLMILLFVVLGALLIVSSMFDMPIGDKANPYSTPASIRPEWYFLAYYWLLRATSLTNSFIIVAIFFIGLFLLPLLDRSPERHPLKRRFWTTLGIIAITIWLVLTILALLNIWPKDLGIGV